MCQKKFSNFNSDQLIFERLEVGGDEILSYKDMLLRLLSTRKEGFFKNIRNCNGAKRQYDKYAQT